MPDIEALQRIIDDPNRSAEDKNIAREALNRINDPVAILEGELLQSIRKPSLGEVEHYDLYLFCASHKFSKAAKALWDRWLFVSPIGRKGVEKTAEYLREHDFEQWNGAALQWKESNWKDSERLIQVLQRIVDSPKLGNYHAEEMVEGARRYLTEVRRRAGETQTGHA
jgi:hypothetical protein